MARRGLSGRGAKGPRRLYRPQPAPPKPSRMRWSGQWAPGPVLQPTGMQGTRAQLPTHAQLRPSGNNSGNNSADS